MDYSTDGPDSSLKEVILAKIKGLKIELSAGRAISLNNLVEKYKTRMTKHRMADPRVEKVLRIEFQRLFVKHISNKMDGFWILNEINVKKYIQMT